MLKGRFLSVLTRMGGDVRDLGAAHKEKSTPSRVNYKQPYTDFES